MTESKSDNELLPNLFRKEYAKMTAVLCRHFGIQHMETAEDIASDTFLKASEYWAIHGVPPNPQAWLYTVAQNKTKDYLKRVSVSERWHATAASTSFSVTEQDLVYDDQVIADSQLAMMFAVCHPANAVEGQICLALQILCGFSVEEIANALLTQTETIKKRLYRSRTRLRNEHFQMLTLSDAEISARLDSVLKTVYLLFNEGYYSKTNDRQIRTELCSEAVRLAVVLTEHPSTNTAKVNALLALMCFQSSRLEARNCESGVAILFEEQDQSKWDQSLIQRGNYYLVNATSGNEVSKYHIEAGIAYWHTTAGEQAKWKHILELYHQLLLIEDSPVVALNRTFAYAKVYGNEAGIREAKQLKPTKSNLYHALLGYLYSDVNIDEAICHFEYASELATSGTEKATLAKTIKGLKKKAVH